MLEEASGESLRVPGFEEWSYEIENKDGAMQVRHHGIELPMKKGKRNLEEEEEWGNTASRN